MTFPIRRLLICATTLLIGAFTVMLLLSLSPGETVQAQVGTRVYLPLVLRNFPPVSDTSYYAGSTSYTEIEAIANEFGDKVLANPAQTDHLVVLSFCNPGTDAGGVQGAYMCRARGYVSAVQAGALAADFAITWKIRTDNTPHRLWLAIGVNNASNMTAAHADAWAFARWYARLNTTGDMLRIFFVGAIDAEQSWNTAANTKTWVNAYMNSTNSNREYSCTPGTGDGVYGCLYNFGTANCGYSPTNVSCGYSDWTKDDIWYISAGAQRTGEQIPFVAALPEIYNTLGNNARQWQSVSLYGATTPGKRKVYFVGSLTQRGACAQVGGCSGIDNPAPVGYLQLYNWLNSDSRTAQSILWSTDIKYQKP